MRRPNRGRLVIRGVLTRFRECNVGQPIMAAAAFQAASFGGKRGLAFATTGSFSVLDREPPRKAAAAMIGCPTSHSPQIPKTCKHPCVIVSLQIWRLLE